MHAQLIQSVKHPGTISVGNGTGAVDAFSQPHGDTARLVAAYQHAAVVARWLRAELVRAEVDPHTMTVVPVLDETGRPAIHIIIRWRITSRDDDV